MEILVVEVIGADGRYDYASYHEVIAEHHAQAAIPPRNNAKAAG